MARRCNEANVPPVWVEYTLEASALHTYYDSLIYPISSKSSC